jgi:hypothetical protein
LTINAEVNAGVRTHVITFIATFEPVKIGRAQRYLGLEIGRLAHWAARDFWELNAAQRFDYSADRVDEALPRALQIRVVFKCFPHPH